MKYSRISLAESFPISASKYFHSRRDSNDTSRIGNSTDGPSKFLFPGMRNFCPHPFAIQAVSRKHQQQSIIRTDCLVDLVVEFFAALDVVRSEPIVDTVLFQVTAQELRELLVPRGVADKAGIEVRFQHNRPPFLFPLLLLAIDKRANCFKRRCISVCGCPGFGPCVQREQLESL